MGEGAELIPWLVVVLVLFVAGVWWAMVVVLWRHDTRARVRAIRERCPTGLITSAQVAAVTHRYLRRIARARGTLTRRTGPYYSIVATPGQLRLVGGGREPFVIALFSAEEIRDGRIGETSWTYANYTSWFVGVSAGQTTYELPIRVNGPEETSLRPATEKWALARWQQVEAVLRQSVQQS